MIIDIFVALLIVIACLRGFQKGLILAIFSILAFIIGLAAALKLSTVAATYMKDSMNVTAKWVPFISFIVVFLVTVLLVRWGGKLIERSIKLVLLGWVNRIGGILLYTALYITILSVFLFYAEKMKFFQASTIESSVTYVYIRPWGPKLIDGFGSVIPLFKDMFTDLENFFDTLAGKIPH